MLITTTRTKKQTSPKYGNGAFGNLVIDTNPFKCLTLENANTLVLPGVYPLRMSWSPHFQQNMPHLIVPNRVMILCHWANWPNQLEGCTALGTEEDFADDMLEQSKDAWIAFCQAISDEPNIMWKIIEDYGA